MEVGVFVVVEEEVEGIWKEVVGEEKIWLDGGEWVLEDNGVYLWVLQEKLDFRRFLKFLCFRFSLWEFLY